MKKEIRGDIMKFEENMEIIKELNKENLKIVAKTLGKESQQYARAKAYWFNHINSRVDGQGSMQDMIDSLEAIKTEYDY